MISKMKLLIQKQKNLRNQIMKGSLREFGASVRNQEIFM